MNLSLYFRHSRFTNQFFEDEFGFSKLFQSATGILTSALPSADNQLRPGPELTAAITRLQPLTTFIDLLTELHSEYTR